MRILNIINDLEDTNKYLSIAYFIDKYSVSKRTLQNDFSYLSKVSSDKGFNIIQKRGLGYLLEIEDSTLFEKFKVELSKYLDQPKLNVESIISCIILNEDYITIDKILGKLRSSRSVVKGYKEDIDSYLEKYNLKLERKSHYGLRIMNSMKERRELIVDLYIKENEIIEEYIDSGLENDFKKIQEKFISKLRENNLVINYMELKEILSWLKVTMYIDKQAKLLKLDDSNNEYGLNLSNEDYNTLQSLIKKKARKKFSRQENIDSLREDLEYFLEQFDKENNTYFNEDEEFKKSLLNHLTELLKRSTFSISYQNPLIDEIQIKYPVAFNMAILLGKMMYKKYNVEIQRDEIGFIATYFAMNMEKQAIYEFRKYNSIAIVCSSGGGSAQLIKFKISSLFEKTNIKTFSLIQMKELEKFNPDIIFSICELDIKLEVPIIYIKELLDDYDILRIKELIMFEKFKEYSLENKEQAFISKFFRSDYFNIDNDSRDYIKCLEDMSQNIELKGAGDYGYSEKVLKRESFAMNIYINGVATPHPIDIDGNENLISVKILQNPIVFEGKKVSLIFMICLKKENIGLYKKISSSLYEIMNDIETVRLLINAKTFKEFVALINQRI
ncbi:PTS sugar transporter subunit IIA [Clostridioides sp. ZZV15-6388]|uniref:BglG family transcription antiterminator n=2 Tax=unclassified Clostridioides TaxID=2635829 RepID=UPI001D12A8AC|nr:PTS sugar transporter subunit IIA [Clostridioides sp. ZZV15-6388]